MYYIVFDMEWNQPYQGAKLEYRNDVCLNNEIIQIGAVKLNEKCEIVDTFETNIKPKKIKHINHNVRKLTGIDESMLATAPEIYDAMESFKKWCGNDFVFIAWGYDDIGVLGVNLKYFGLDTLWLPPCYNLQMIFCSQTENINKQYSLTYAAEHFNIELDKPLHNALTDAYYTAKVCGKLDLKTGIEKYKAMVFKDNSIPEHMKNIIYKRTYPSVSDYGTLLADSKIKTPVCHNCGEKLDNVSIVQNGDYNYLTFGRCKIHGDFAELLKVNKTPEKSFNATEMFFAIDEYNREYFRQKARKMNMSNTKRKMLAAKKNANIRKNEKRSDYAKVSAAKS